jgi:3-hydroxyisobutyrate dehydrogenase
MIAFLGTGLLGANFVKAMRRRGAPVQVWNRTVSKARALETDGARAFDEPADAVRGADQVHLALTDDAVVDEVLDRAAGGLARGTVIVDHSTTLPSTTVERVTRWTERGFPFQHAPVFMGPGNALESTGTMLVSGDRALFDRLKPSLEPMTGTLLYLGPDPSRAAATKLTGNLYLIVTMGGVADMLRFATASGLSVTEATRLFELFDTGRIAPARTRRMLHEDLSEPTWTLAMARKDVRLMLESARERGLELDVMPAIAREMDRAIDAGHGAHDWLAFGRSESR